MIQFHAFEGKVEILNVSDPWVRVRVLSDGAEVLTTAAQLFGTQAEADAERARVLGQ